MSKHDPSLIPDGDFCYRAIPGQCPDVTTIQSEDFGCSKREAKWGKTETIHLCPYWQRTGYGTVRCEYLNKEVLEWKPNAREKAEAQLGRRSANRLEELSLLADMHKSCGIRLSTRDGLVRLSQLFNS